MEDSNIIIICLCFANQINSLTDTFSEPVNCFCPVGPLSNDVAMLPHLSNQLGMYNVTNDIDGYDLWRNMNVNMLFTNPAGHFKILYKTAAVH